MKDVRPALWLGVVLWVVSILAASSVDTLQNGADQGSAVSTGHHADGPSVPIDKKLLVRAEAATESLVLENLKSPASAQFSAFQVIDSSGPYFQTKVTVDSQNSYGAMMRGDFVVAFKLEDGGKFSFNRATAVQAVSDNEYLPLEENDRILKSVLEFQKSGLNWPGSEERKRERMAKEAEERARAEKERAVKQAAEQNAAEKARDGQEARGEKAAKEQNERESGGGFATYAKESSDRLKEEESAWKVANAMRAIPQVEKDLKNVNALIASERDKWKEAVAVINQLTNNKRTPVKEGSDAYWKCQRAASVIKEVESNAESLKAKKVELETSLNALQQAAGISAPATDPAPASTDPFHTK